MEHLLNILLNNVSGAGFIARPAVLSIFLPPQKRIRGTGCLIRPARAIMNLSPRSLPPIASSAEAAAALGRQVAAAVVVGARTGIA